MPYIAAERNNSRVTQAKKPQVAFPLSGIATCGFSLFFGGLAELFRLRRNSRVGFRASPGVRKGAALDLAGRGPAPAKGLRPFRDPFWGLLGVLGELFSAYG